jgi:hypothetical protein
MNWDAIGAIGETIGALAVFLTLVYLSIQIRQNTKAVQAAAIDSANSQVSKIREQIFDIDGTLVDSNEVDGDLFLSAVKIHLGKFKARPDWADYTQVTELWCSCRGCGRYAEVH